MQISKTKFWDFWYYDVVSHYYTFNGKLRINFFECFVQTLANKNKLKIMDTIISAVKALKENLCQYFMLSDDVIVIESESFASIEPLVQVVRI